MKNYVSALVLTALLLTGCGSIAPAAEDSNSAAGSSSEAATAAAESKQSEDNTVAEAAAATQEFYDYYGIDMPIPSGMQENSSISRSGLHCWSGGTESSTVYLVYDLSSNDEYQNPANGHTLDELPESFLWLWDKYLYKMYESNANDDFTNISINEKTETEFMGVPVLRESGVITTYNDTKINYAAYYAYANFPSLAEHVPAIWFACTTSDDKDAIELMNSAVDAPLTQAKLN